MKTNEVFEVMSDNVSICIHSFIPDNDVRGIMVIVHGMVEHALRYSSFAEVLTQNGFAVFVHDQRGHGKTAGTSERYGHFGDGIGFERIVDDVNEVIQYAKKQYPDVNIVLMGHSFGSFVSQRYMERFGTQISRCILSGTAGPRLALMNIAKCLAGSIASIFGEKHISKLLDGLAFGANLKRIENPKTPKDWISRDEKVVEAYINDSACGFDVTSAFFREMFTLLATIHKKSEMKKIPKNLPIYLFAGDKDPVGDYGKTVELLAFEYKNLGIQDVTVKMYPDGRHEMLNETNKDDVITDILSWL